jgi:hypothetical protein
VKKLSLPGTARLIPRLVTEYFNPNKPYVSFSGFNNSRTLYNIEGWRANALPDRNDPTLLGICGKLGAPTGVGSLPIFIPDTPVELVARTTPVGEVYRHESNSLGVLWLPVKPKNIIATENKDHGSDADCDEEDDNVGNR